MTKVRHMGRGDENDDEDETHPLSSVAVVALSELEPAIPFLF